MDSAMTVPRAFALLAVLSLAACKGDSITSRDPDAVFGNAQIAIQSFGVDLDGDGYRLDVRGIEEHVLPTSGEVDLRVPVGPARLTLRGVAENCVVAHDTVRTVTVDAETVAQVSFVVTCGGGEEHLAFASRRNGDINIFVQPEDGSSVVQITNSQWTDTDPVWSPHGNRLAFATQSPDSSTTYIRITTADGDSLGTIGWPGAHAAYPAWAPSTDRIAFVGNVTGNFELYTVNADGSGLTRLTTTPENEFRPAWSPDGAYLVYDRDVTDSVARDLFITDANGGVAERLSTGGRYNFNSAWSPDGERIAFMSQRDGNEEIYTVGVFSGALHRLTNSGASDGGPVWSADGRSVVFASNRTGTLNLFRVSLSGQTVQLTTGAADDFDPALSR